MIQGALSLSLSDDFVSRCAAPSARDQWRGVLFYLGLFQAAVCGLVGGRGRLPIATGEPNASLGGRR